MRKLLSAVIGATLFAGAFAAHAEDARSGAFSGVKGHVAAGVVTVTKTDEGYEVSLSEDFSFDGAPDARVGFGHDGEFAEGTDFELLRSNSGAQIYKAPASLDASDYDTVMLWCRQYSVPLAAAPLE